MTAALQIEDSTAGLPRAGRGAAALEEEVGRGQRMAAGQLDRKIGHAIAVGVAEDQGLEWIAGIDPQLPRLVGESALANEGKGLIAIGCGRSVDADQIDLVYAIFKVENKVPRRRLRMRNGVVIENIGAPI